MAHKKAGGSSRNGRDSKGRRLGVKKFGGEQVVGGSSPKCGTCRRCREGKPSQCENRSTLITDHFDGAFAEFVLVRAAVRVTASFKVKESGKTLTIPAYVDEIGFAYGQAEVELDVISTFAAPSSALEKRFAMLLVARAHSVLG